MEIETKSASLDTLAVTIQALHVNGKQMTLAVFRQLPVATAYNDDGSLSPLEYWGIVRYDIRNQGDLWAVCASAGRLYRCSLDHGKESIERLNAKKNWMQNCLKFWLYVDDFKKQHGENAHPNCTPPYGFGRWKNDGLNEWNNELSIVENDLKDSTRAEITYKTLCELPQLFIAV